MTYKPTAHIEMIVGISHTLVKQMIENRQFSIQKGQKGYVVGSDSPNRFIQNTEKLLGVFADKNYENGSVLRELSGLLFTNPTRESIHVGRNMHVVDIYGKYMNHSFDPNVKIVNNKVIALRDIKQFEEITFNYNDSEINMACPFEVDGKKVCGIMDACEL